MKLRLNQLQKNLATFSFLLLFPGYFFYHYAIGRDYIPPVLGGYFGIVSVFLLVPLAMANLKLVIKNFDLPVLIFFAIMLLTLVVAVMQYVLGNPKFLTEEMLAWSISGFIFNLVCFFVAARLSIKEVAKYGYWLIPLMATIVLLNIGDRGFFYLKAEVGEFSSIVSGYQGFGRSIVTLLLLVCGFYYKRRYRLYPLIIIGIVGLFFNGARTEFILFILVLVVVKLFYSIRSPRNFLSLFFLMGISVLFMVNFAELFIDSRISGLLDLSSGTSASIRLIQISYAIEQTFQNPVLGNYGSYVELGGVGSYPHNLLSAWLNLGLVGLSLYVSLFIALWIIALKGFLDKNNDEYFNVFLFFLVFVSAALIVSKDHSYMLVGLLVGFYVQLSGKKKEILQ
jgi:hypothetical protein